MRRILISATLAVVLVTGSGGQAAAAPPESAPRPAAVGWSLTGDELTWRSDTLVPISDAGVEFWSGDKRLGHARPHPDGRSCPPWMWIRSGSS